VNRARGIALRLLPWVITIACFWFLYGRVAAGAARAGAEPMPYLAAIFQNVSWGWWLAIVIPYSVFFFAIDTLVVWRVVSWFNAPVRYLDILPIRGSAYILSIINEQVGKGAMALYLNRRDGVPGWEVASSMLFIMFCEFFYLLSWATLGVLLRWDRLPEILHWIPLLAAGSAVFLAGWMLYFRGSLLPGHALRERPILLAFRRARPWQYLTVVLLRSPAMLAAVLVYTLTLGLFGVDVGFGEMFGYLPVIFFGAATPGPMRSVAIVLWVVLFPGREAEMTAFGFVMHNFFIFFNAAIGLLFLRRASRDLLDPA
jgi:hypothetical protein